MRHSPKSSPSCRSPRKSGHCPQPGVAYAGVPFRADFVTLTALKNDAIGSLLDAYLNNYPLRGDLGDRPDEWLELRGRGTARVGHHQTGQ